MEVKAGHFVKIYYKHFNSSVYDTFWYPGGTSFSKVLSANNSYKCRTWMTSRGGTYLGSIYVRRCRWPFLPLWQWSSLCWIQGRRNKGAEEGGDHLPPYFGRSFNQGWGGLKAHHTTCPPSGFSDLPTALALVHTKSFFHKGVLISEGILALVPLPIKPAKSLPRAENLNR